MKLLETITLNFKMSMATKNKPWFRINKDVEYSTDFDFFLKNQIRIIRSGTRHSFCSALEAKKFKEKTAFNSKGIIDEAELKNDCLLIHQEILSGKHGVGEFVE